MAGPQDAAEATPQQEPAPVKPSRRGKLILLGIPVALALLGAGLWSTSALSRLLGQHGGAAAGSHAPIYVDLPEMIANLDSDPRRPRYIKMRARVEVTSPRDEQAVREAMPRLIDLCQTYLRDIRPEDLRGSMGTYRLREELIARADVAVAPARVVDLLFVDMIVQ